MARNVNRARLPSYISIAAAIGFGAVSVVRLVLSSRSDSGPDVVLPSILGVLAICALYSAWESWRVSAVQRRFPDMVVVGFTTYQGLVDQVEALRSVVPQMSSSRGRILSYPFHYALAIGEKEVLLVGGVFAGSVRAVIPGASLVQVSEARTNQGGWLLGCLRLVFEASGKTFDCDFCVTDQRTFFPFVAGHRYRVATLERLRSVLGSDRVAVVAGASVGGQSGS